MSLSFYANGKLLLSGEYFVLDGAEAIGLPCRYGQSLEISPRYSDDLIYWKSKTVDQKVWFEGFFHPSDFKIIKSTDQKIAETLQNILYQARVLNPDFLKEKSPLNVETALNFPRLWGLGTSSTLIFNIAQWSEVDPFVLSAKTLGGSGYDVACAGVDAPILYQIKEGQSTFVEVDFNPPFKEQLFFVYLSKKQNSREGIKRYREKGVSNGQQIAEISALSNAVLAAKTLIDFQKIIIAHEEVVSKAIEMPKVQDLYFSDFEGVVKSLGAWGGDFVLVATEMERSKVRDYFNKRGYGVFLGYEEMIKR